MSITYTYTIASVDENARCMEIIYESEGHQTMRVGARLPFEGESLENVVQAYSPLSIWEAMITPVAPPKIGATGTIMPASTETNNPGVVDTQVDTPVQNIHEV